MVKKVISDESGRVLVWTLVILGIGALLIPPLLASISTNLLATRAIEEDLKEQYAADAGVEHAIFRMSTGDYILEESFDTPTPVNNLPVSVTITQAAQDAYKIVSEAGDTTIESYVSTNYSNLLWLLDNAITSNGNVTLRPNTTVTGDVMYSEDGVITGEDRIVAPFEAITMTTSFIEENWPSSSDLSDFYMMDVQGLDPYPNAIIDVGSGTEANPYPIGPLYYVGYSPDHLQILSTVVNATVVLTGTVYVAGDLDIGQTNQNFTLDLNGHTIYVEGELKVGGKCTLTGSGCIIAEGDITFLPNIESGADDFVLIMSVDGTSTVNPSGSLYGAVAGNTVVDLQPGNKLMWTNPYNKELNFPTGSKGFMEFVTYRIY